MTIQELKIAPTLNLNVGILVLLAIVLQSTAMLSHKIVAPIRRAARKIVIAMAEQDKLRASRDKAPVRVRLEGAR